MQSRFSEITDKMQKQFPRWSRINRDPDSVGAQLLNVFALQYDDIEFYLQYASDNYFIGTADLRQVDVIYKVNIPHSLSEEHTLRLTGSGMKLNEMVTLKKFFEGIDSRHLERKEVYYPNPYTIDWTRKVIYFKKAYDVDTYNPEGKVHLVVENDEKEVIFEYDLQQMVHHVWNFFDEFGLLLDTPRLYGEKNREYKERILDVFRHPANATKQGLENLMGRELGLWKEVKWYDGAVDIAIPYSNIVESSIEVDREDWDRNEWVYDTAGRIKLKGNPDYSGVIRTIRFISGLQMHTFHNLEDYAFQKDLYSVDRVASPMLKYYVDLITNRVPIMWDKFIWNESFWDVADKELTGHGHIPSHQDANFLGWLKYEE